MREVLLIDCSELSSWHELSAYWEANNDSYHAWDVGTSEEEWYDEPCLFQLDKDLAGLGLDKGTEVLICISW